jgi:hypothetical protein
MVLNVSRSLARAVWTAEGKEREPKTRFISLFIIHLISFVFSNSVRISKYYEWREEWTREAAAAARSFLRAIIYYNEN